MNLKKKTDTLIVDLKVMSLVNFCMRGIAMKPGESLVYEYLTSFVKQTKDAAKTYISFIKVVT